MELIPLEGTKPLFTVAKQPHLFGKQMSRKEIRLQKVAARLGVAPTIHSIVKHDGMNVAVMSRIQGSTLADLYGPDSSIPIAIWSHVRALLQTLWNHGIEYVDITPYNIMLETETDRMWIVDFGHARNVRMNPHLRAILEGANEWNADFR
jgi:tRNA A-37 threonylcarbamoyl transferase component Bud32